MAKYFLTSKRIFVFCLFWLYFHCFDGKVLFCLFFRHRVASENLLKWWKTILQRFTFQVCVVLCVSPFMLMLPNSFISNKKTEHNTTILNLNMIARMLHLSFALFLHNFHLVFYFSVQFSTWSKRQSQTRLTYGTCNDTNDDKERHVDNDIHLDVCFCFFFIHISR